MSNFWQTAVNNPKTTISGVLSFVAITCATLIPFVPVTARYAFGGLAIAGALSKAYLLAISKDAGTVEAIVPGSPAPQAVPSTEIPLDPKDKLVTPPAGAARNKGTKS
jgi:hypothetical protein